MYDKDCKYLPFIIDSFQNLPLLIFLFRDTEILYEKIPWCKKTKLYLYIFGQKSKALFMGYDFCVRRRKMMIIKTNYHVNVLLFELVKILFFIKSWIELLWQKEDMMYANELYKLPPM